MTYDASQLAKHANSIRRLSPELIREIAAGEVITSPCDVLKELVDNALDAGATRLDVALEEGGKAGICVTDNGFGMSADDLELATEQHSTSKLASLTDICTLGFRGEGLYAIRQAARLSLTSRPVEQLGGAVLTAEGEESWLEPSPCPSGTRAEVHALFDKLPARRRALEPAQEELRKCTALLNRYILHRPELKISLSSNGEPRWTYAGGSFAEAAKFVWGPVTANRLLALEVRAEAFGLSGLMSRPELTRPRRDRLLLAVNGRPVMLEDRWLKVIWAAYRELLPSGHYPVAILNLNVPVTQVLVNTAPDKSRVRFLAENEVLAFLKEALEISLAHYNLAPALPDLGAFEGVTEAPRHGFPTLAYVGSYRDLYLLAEGDGSLWVVDQHAAHERVLYETLLERYRREAPVELVHPELLPLSHEEAESYLARQEGLAQKGLRLEPFGGGRWRIRTLPAFLAAYPELVAETVKQVLVKNSLEEAWRKTLGRLACLPAIKAGYALADADAQQLLDALHSCETPWVCPHGRPTALVLSEISLARRFGRRAARMPAGHAKGKKAGRSL